MSTRALLYGGLLVPPVFVAGFLVEGATRAGYSPWRHAVSLRGRPDWSSWRAYSIATGVTVAVMYPVTVVLTSLDQAGAWTDAPAGLTQRITMITGIGWCALLAGRLLETTPRRRLDHAPTGGRA